MLRIQNRCVDWDSHQIAIPGHTTKDKENRRIPFDADGRLAAILARRASLGPTAFVFDTEGRLPKDDCTVCELISVPPGASTSCAVARNWSPAQQRTHEHVGRLEVAMDDGSSKRPCWSKRSRWRARACEWVQCLERYVGREAVAS